MAIKKLLIANRGEIAVRIIRAARELGIKTVQVHSVADAGSLAVRLADESVVIGPPAVKKSYLNAEAILAAAQESGVDAIHPGYGFFAENADFADSVVEAGHAFIGPAAETIRMMGDKVAARKAAADAGVPTVPGSDGGLDDVAAAQKVAAKIGYPVMVKAAAGGGGLGIRVAADDDELAHVFPQASGEALTAFGDGALYVEKVIDKARHIEVQVLGDGKDVIHCYERECSIQRRRQKIWEEAPCAFISAETRAALCGTAVKLAKAVKYRGAGTLEFLYDESSDKFYFIEMNTRIQVEHPVTEWVTGIDLVGEMIRIASGESLRFKQEDVRLSGHAIEVRINAEDPSMDFLPVPGIATHVRLPGGPGVRIDTMLFHGCAVPPFYDSLLGKLIVWGETRDHAIARLKAALKELEIDGVRTTTPLFHHLVDDPDVRAGSIDTQWLESWLAANRSRWS